MERKSKSSEYFCEVKILDCVEAEIFVRYDFVSGMVDGCRTRIFKMTKKQIFSDGNFIWIAN